jgi:hypothetical protein
VIAERNFTQTHGSLLEMGLTLVKIVGRWENVKRPTMV